MRDVIVQRRGIEMLCGRQLFHLLPPLREESGAFLPDERCQFIEVIDGFIMWFGAGLSRLARLSRPQFADRAEISFHLYLRPSGWELQLFARRPKMESGAGSNAANVHL